MAMPPWHIPVEENNRPSSPDYDLAVMFDNNMYMLPSAPVTRPDRDPDVFYVNGKPARAVAPFRVVPVKPKPTAPMQPRIEQEQIAVWPGQAQQLYEEESDEEFEPELEEEYEEDEMQEPVMPQYEALPPDMQEDEEDDRDLQMLEQAQWQEYQRIQSHMQSNMQSHMQSHTQSHMQSHMQYPNRQHLQPHYIDDGHSAVAEY